MDRAGFLVKISVFCLYDIGDDTGTVATQMLLRYFLLDSGQSARCRLSFNVGSFIGLCNCEKVFSRRCRETWHNAPFVVAPFVLRSDEVMLLFGAVT